MHIPVLSGLWERFLWWFYDMDEDYRNVIAEADRLIKENEEKRGNNS